MLHRKTGKTFWFSSLGQMVQFGAIIFCRTFKNYFGQFVWIEKKRKKRVIIIVAFHFMKRRLKSGSLAKDVKKRNKDYDFPTRNKFVGAENKTPTEQRNIFRPNPLYNYIKLRLKNSQCTTKNFIVLSFSKSVLNISLCQRSGKWSFYSTNFSWFEQKFE